MSKPCFRCDGTKEICDVCGESAGACQCGEEDGATYSTCPDCGGSGRGDAKIIDGKLVELGGEAGAD